MGNRVEESNVSVTAGDTKLVEVQMKRARLVIGTPKTATVWITLKGKAVVGQGLPLRPGTAPLVLGDHFFGPAITHEIRAISDGVTEIIGVWDFFT